MTANRCKATTDERRSPALALEPPDRLPAACDPYDADEIREQLGRIVASGALRNSPRLRRFLTFVVETTLAGAGERIKAYTIAVEALGRGSDFDPQSDPIVRVAACRLRQALARYYVAAGRNDPLVIDLPVGTYVPTFRRRGADSARPYPAMTRRHRHRGSGHGSDRMAEIAAHGERLSRLLAKLQELLDIQRLQVVAVADAIASATQTLHHAHALLQSAAPPGPAGSAPRRHGLARPRDPHCGRASDPRR